MPLPNYIVGMAHGVLFMMYIILVLQVAFLLKWNFIKIFLALLASFIPFGTFYADKKLFRS
jgi:integral membrane protein